MQNKTFNTVTGLFADRDYCHSAGDTCCQDCCFAIYENKTQIDCQLNKLELYSNAKIEIIEAYNEDGEFFLLHNKKCIWKRSKKWLDKHYATAEQDVANECKLQVCYVIYCIETTTKENLINTIKNIHKGKLLPTKVVIINNGVNLRPSEFKQICNEHIPNLWTLEIILQEGLDLEGCLNVTANRLRGQYTAVFSTNRTIVPKFIDELDFYINEKMIPIVFQEQNDIIIIQNLFFKLCNHKISTCRKMTQELSQEK